MGIIHKKLINKRKSIFLKPDRVTIADHNFLNDFGKEITRILIKLKTKECSNYFFYNRIIKALQDFFL
jgi:hypothetical protein